MTLNPVAPNKIGKLYTFVVRLNYETGDVIFVYRESPKSLKDNGFLQPSGDIFDIEVLREKKQTAIKIANEKRLAYKTAAATAL